MPGGSDNDYVAQVWQARPGRGSLRDPLLVRRPVVSHEPVLDVYPHLVELMPEFDRWPDAEGPPGIPSTFRWARWASTTSSATSGMIGLPMAPCTTFPVTRRRPFHAALAARPETRGGTPGAGPGGQGGLLTWRSCKTSGTANWAGVQHHRRRRRRGVVDLPRPRGFLGIQAVEAARPFAFPRIQTSTWPYVRERPSCARTRTSASPDHPYPRARWTFSTCPTTAMTCCGCRTPCSMPSDAVFRGAGRAAHGSGGVALYPFGERQYVLYNMNDGIREGCAAVPSATPPVHGRSGCTARA